MMEYLILK